MMTVASHSTAQKRNSPCDERNHKRPNAYLALLRKGPRDSVERAFVKRSKNSTGTQLLFSVETQPGDIYELRNWHWDMVRQTFLGGTSYIGFDEHNEPVALTREEAFASILTPPVRRHPAAGTTSLVAMRPQRTLPAGVYFS